MNLKPYLKNQIIPIIIYLVALTIVAWMLVIIHVPLYLIAICMITLLVSGLTIFFYNYSKRRQYFNSLFDSLSSLDQKYLVHELIHFPDYYEGQLFYFALSEIDKATMDYLNSYKFMLDDFKEYLELWIHEIKIPLASARLIVENNKDTISLNMIEELNRVEALVEQVLFYVRSENVEKDYTIKKCNLEQIIKDVIKENRRSFIYKKISLQLENLNLTVLTDAKWMTFILNQIISNSLKYSKGKDAYIKISASQNVNNVFLYIEDNGIGISPNDIERVFEKGFTGANGRKNYNSTGIGLYLCKSLCDKLYHQLNIQSKLNKGTKVIIVFPIGAYSNIIKN